MRRTADIVVIGAGINGCAIAWHLAKRRPGRILLLDRGFVACGQTGRSNGIVRQHYTIPTLAQMARDSLDVFENFRYRVGGNAGFHSCGYAVLCGFENAALLAKTVEMHRRLGIRVSLLSAEELKEFEPQLSVEDVACGAYEPGGGYADPVLASHSFCEAARRERVELLTSVEVLGLRVERARIAGIVTTDGEIATRTVVNAAGPWGASIAASAGVTLPVRVTRHAVTVFRRPATWRQPTPVWADLTVGRYFKPDETGMLMVGSLEDDQGSVDPDMADELTSAPEMSAASVATVHRFRVMEEGLAQRAWAGLFDATPDGLPILDRAPGVEGLFCAFGFSGHGFKLAPAVGQIVSEQVVDSACHSYDTGVFRADRFARGHLHRGGYAYSIVA